MRLSSDRLHYEIFSESTRALYSTLMMDGRVTRYIFGDPLSLVQADQKFDHILRLNNKNPQFGSFAVFRIDDHSFVGLAKFTLDTPGRAEVGYGIVPDLWGNGFGQEILTALVAYGREHDFINELWAIIDPEHKVSKKMLLKQGFFVYKNEVLDGASAEYLELILSS